MRSLLIHCAGSTIAMLGTLLLSVPAQAAVEITDLSFSTIGIEEGLSQNTVSAICQDRRGRLWFGTQDGLNLYDGYSIRHYQADSENAHSLPHSYIESLHVDRDGAIWVGTYAGLAVYDPDLDRFDSVGDADEASLDINAYGVTTLCEAPGGGLWIGTEGQGLRWIEGEGTAVRAYDPDANPSSVLSTGHIRDIVAQDKHSIWLGANQGLFLLNPDSGQLRRVGTLTQITGLLLARDGTLWVGTDGSGVYRMTTADSAPKAYAAPGLDRQSQLGRFVNSIYEDREGTVWIATRGGVIRNQVDIGSARLFQHDPLDAKSFPDGSAETVFEDLAGVLWFGTGSAGLVRWISPQGRFPHYRFTPGDRHSVGQNAVFGVAENANGELWFATDGGGLLRVDSLMTKVKQYRPDPTRPRSIPSSHARTVYISRDGMVWVGFDKEGAGVLDPKTGDFEHLRPVAEDKSDMGVGAVRPILEDRQGRMWLGTYGAGLFRYDRQRRSFESYRHESSAPKSLCDDYVYSLLQSTDGTLWIGTDGGGLDRYDPESDRFDHFEHIDKDPTSITSNSVLSIVEGADGFLWLGHDGGLSHFDPATGRATQYSEADGLPNGMVYSAVPDDLGNVWMSTNNGLARLDPRSGVVQCFGKSDGVQDAEFNGHSWCATRDGRLIFGGINGFNYFDPQQIQSDLYEPPIAITELRVLNELITPSTILNGRLVLGRSIGESDTLVVPYDLSTLSFRFAALHFVAPEKNQYSYFMEGYDDSWNDVGTRNYASYTRLPPGSYTLRVRGSNHDGVWAQREATLAVRILPPFWMTWWFRSAGVLIGLLATWGVMGLRTRAIRVRNRQLEAHVKARTSELESEVSDRIRAEADAHQARQDAEAANQAKSQFLANMSHEIRTPMNGVIGMTEFLLESELDADQRECAGTAHECANLLLGVINDILDFSKIEAGRLDLEKTPFDLREVCSSAERLLSQRASKKHLRLAIDIAASVPESVVGDPIRLRQILINLANNAIKFTDRGGVTIRISADPINACTTRLSVAVQDTGIGIDKDVQKRLFKAFSQADESTTRRYGGTGLGLAISAELVELMNGSISVSSEIGVGSTFSFQIEMGLPTSPVVGTTDDSSTDERTVETLDPMCILLAEDNVVNQKLARRILERAGHEVHTVADGQAALDALRARAFDIVLMDVQMPVMDGIEATRRLREGLGGPNSSTIPVIALTAHAMKGDRDRCLAAGMNDYVTKPIRRPDLFASMARQTVARSPEVVTELV